jgi:hypothetical protein
MGDAEFAGGGSVKWEVTNTDGESGGGNKNKCKGKDKDPKGPNGKFIVTITGHAPIIVPVDGTVVRVIWGDEAAQTGVGTDSSTTKKTARTTKAKP